MKFANKIPFLLMFPIAAIAVFAIGSNVVDVPSQIVDSSRRWLLILSAVYVVNYTMAWFLRNSWTSAMIRMLGCGLFAYIAISELVDLLGGAWGHWRQLLGADGTLAEPLVNALRYTVTSWTVGLVMMAICIALGFDSEKAADS